MLHKIFLTFTDPVLEQEYQVNQRNTIIREYSAYSLIASVALVIGILQQRIQLILVSTIGLILITVLWIIVSKCPPCTNFLYPFIQFCIAAFITNDNLILSASEEKLDPRYYWCFGYFAGFLHLSLFQQGTFVCPQTISLLGIFTWYMTKANLEGTLGVYICVVFISILTTMVRVRRVGERNKRNLFIIVKQNKTWFEIVESLVKQGLVLIKFDARIDQIKMLKHSKSIAFRYAIRTNSALRQFTRNVMILVNNQKSSLETIIRNILLQKNSYTNHNVKRDNQLYNEFVGIDKQTLKSYQIKLIEHFQIDYKTVIMIIKKKELVSLTDQNQKGAYLQLLNNISQKGLELSIQLLKQLPHEKLFSLPNFLPTFNYFGLLQIWMNSHQLFQSKCMQQVEINSIIDQIRLQVKYMNFSTHNNCDHKIITTCKPLLTQACLSILNYLYKIQVKQELIVLTIKQKQVDGHSVTSFIFQHACEIKEEIKQFLESIQPYYGFSQICYNERAANENLNTICQNYVEVIKLIDVKTDMLQIALGLTITKFILQHLGLTNIIRCNNNKIRFSIIDFQEDI